MQDLTARATAIAARRIASLVDTLVETAAAELPPGLSVERRADGIAITGDGLTRRLAFDARLRGLSMLLKANAR